MGAKTNSVNAVPLDQIKLDKVYLLLDDDIFRPDLFVNSGDLVRITEIFDHKIGVDSVCMPAGGSHLYYETTGYGVTWWLRLVV